MIGQTVPANAAPQPGFDVFVTLLGRIMAKLIRDRAHCDVVVQIRNGKVELVRLNSSFLPGQLPHI